MDNKLNQSLDSLPTSPSFAKKSFPIFHLGSESAPNSPNLLRNAITSNLAKNPQINNVLSGEGIQCPPSPTPSMRIDRPAYNVSEFNKNYEPNETEKTAKERFKKYIPDLSRKAWMHRLAKYIPITQWLPEYNLKQNLIADIIVGITIASFQVPQSMGYALIATVNPVYGLYSAFFPCLMYIIFGTSRHSAVGPVAIVAGLMTGIIVDEVKTELNLNGKDAIPKAGFENVTGIDIAIMVSMVIGIYILVFGICQLGFISNYLSGELISGFMCASALYIFTTQLHYLFGVDIDNFSGPLALIKTYIQFFSRIGDSNPTAVIISFICCSILLFFKLVVEKLFEKMGLKLPFPIHLFIIIGGCIASNLMELNENYHIQIVGEIPNHFQNPLAPNFKLFPYVWSKCIPVAVVSYILTLSIGRIYGAKHNYVVEANQEMIALGISNVWASFFACLPAAASIPRSSVQESGGGKTQIVSVVNCICILIVILVFSSLLSELPNCVLASCIAVALASIIAKFQELFNFWRISKVDASVWIVTFLSVMILNLDYGVYIGFGYSLLLLIYKSQRPKTYSLGSVDNSDIYVPISKFKRAQELEGVKIYQFCGALNFANIEYFKNELQTRSGVDVRSIKEELEALTPKTSCFIFHNTNQYKEEMVLEMIKNLPKYIIIDCSMLSYIDTTGVTTLKRLIQSHADINVTVQLAGCPVHIETMLKKDGFFKEVSSDYVYKSVHDAVTYIRETDQNIGNPNINLNQNYYLPKILSKISLDANQSFNKEANGLKAPNSPRSIIKDSPNNSPNLNRPPQSVTFSYH